MQEEIDRHKAEIQRASEHIETLTWENGLMKDEISRASKYIEMVNQELEARDRALDQLRSQLDELETRLAVYEGKDRR